MKQFANKAWNEVIKPAFRRPDTVQLAALCYRKKKSRTEVLLVNSSAGRWILPKGWPVEGLDGPETAMREAWEEAGVRRGKPSGRPFASFNTVKRLDSGVELPCEIHVYPVKVKERVGDFPEADQRSPQWVTLDKALKLVDDPGLAGVLQQFAASGIAD